MVEAAGIKAKGNKLQFEHCEGELEALEEIERSVALAQARPVLRDRLSRTSRCRPFAKTGTAACVASDSKSSSLTCRLRHVICQGATSIYQLYSCTRSQSY